MSPSEAVLTEPLRRPQPLNRSLALTRPLLLEHAIVGAGLNSRLKVCQGWTPLTLEQVTTLHAHLLRLPELLQQLRTVPPRGYLLLKNPLESATDDAAEDGADGDVAKQTASGAQHGLPVRGVAG